MPEEFNLPKIEEKILKFWEENHIFEKTLALRQAADRRGLNADHRGHKHGPPKTKTSHLKAKTFVFYEGPPYANGKPGIHHVLARIVKDIILRYKTMRGYYVPRRAGWDTHGLPVEMATEKALGLKSKKDIEKFGIAAFNRKAKEQVWIYKDEWEEMTKRIGYWLNLKDAYVTYEPEYIETLWWTISQIAKRKLLYKGRKVVPWCPRCGTALSSHELALGYKETTEQSVYLKFRLRSGQKIGEDIRTDENTYILSWTTTPWTLPGNVALAVGGKINYAVVKKMVGGAIERWIVAEEIIKKGGNPFGRESDVREIISGDELAGLNYEPLFDLTRTYADSTQKYADKIYRVYTADFVATDEGTGVVHTAVMYGEDDYQLGVKVGLPQRHTVDEEGKFTRDVPGLGGLPVKTKETDEKIFEHLRKNGNLFKIEPYTHEYPYCWRCETPVLYYARSSWFIAMSKLREKLLANNKKINWIPAHLKEGRFGEWLREVKDWNLSRERYWGAPLPIWECKSCGRAAVAGSLDELNRLAGGSKNNYWVMRHGFSETLLARVIDDGRGRYHLTPQGKKQAGESAKKLNKDLQAAKSRINIIISSDVLRTKETARIAAAALGVKNLIFDKRLREINLGAIEGQHETKYKELFPTYESRFEKRPEGGESLRDLRARLWDLLRDLEKKYKGKNILFVTHEYPIWMLQQIALGWSEKLAIAEKEKKGRDFVAPAEYGKLDLKVIPRNETGEVDLHRPYADVISIKCPGCGKRIQRVREVADVWYDSGAMPFAQAHFPFENAPALRTSAELTRTDAENVLRKSAFSPRSSASRLAYPADYIAEGMDQTRGWFYTLLAIATALGYGAPYKNVISHGLINDKNGQKMSKSKGNVVNTWETINKYGVDAIRWYFYVINPLGEPKNFDEAEISKVFRRFHLLLWNSFRFYQTYADTRRLDADKRGFISDHRRSNLRLSAHPLDKWILARLNETVAGVTKNLDKYGIREAALLIEVFVDDLSRWYIRRSRRRLSAAVKGYGGQARRDYHFASATLGFVLRETVKLIAPFTPFFSELLYKQLRGFTRTTRGSTQIESVHLSDWPVPDSKLKAKSSKLISAMAEVRRLASLGLAKRAEAGIKVRQPLQKLKVKSEKLKVKLNGELLAILAEEVNVKEIVFDKKLKEEVALDTNVTPELREEGILREVVRMVQELRQKAGLKPKDEIILFAVLPAEIRLILHKKEALLKKETGAREIEYKKSEKFDAEEMTKFEDKEIWLAVRKT